MRWLAAAFRWNARQVLILAMHPAFMMSGLLSPAGVWVVTVAALVAVVKLESPEDEPDDDPERRSPGAQSGDAGVYTGLTLRGHDT